MKFMLFNLVFNTVHADEGSIWGRMLENCFADIYRFFTAFRRVVEDFFRKMTKHRKRKIKNQKSKNHGKTRDLETGDSDTHHHPYRHRHEHRGGELYVRGLS